MLPNRIALKPVARADEPAMLAAAKAPSATGGVINDNIPQ